MNMHMHMYLYWNQYHNHTHLCINMYIYIYISLRIIYLDICNIWSPPSCKILTFFRGRSIQENLKPGRRWPGVADKWQWRGTDLRCGDVSPRSGNTRGISWGYMGISWNHMIIWGTKKKERTQTTLIFNQLANIGSVWCVRTRSSGSKHLCSGWL